MTPARKPFRSQWTPKKAEPKPAPESESMKKAKHLPMFGPGIVITVPLHLLPEYFQLYSLEPQGMKPSGILLVKRVPKSEGE